MLVDFGIITLAEDRVTLAEDWLDKLQTARETGGEIEADKLAEAHRKRRSAAYRNRHKPTQSKPTADGLAAVHRSREKSRKHRRENLIGWVEQAPQEVSPLAVAVREYLERNPRDARQPVGWLGTTLWCLELYDGQPTPGQTRAALDELGGGAFLDKTLKQAQAA
jgi:hypothetical protein